MSSEDKAISPSRTKVAEPIDKARDHTLVALQASDDICGSNMAERWKEIVAVHDANELVRLNIQQTQIVIQEHFDRMVRRRALNDKRLADLMDASIKAEDDKKRTRIVDTYCEERDRALKEERADMQVFQNLTRTEVALASEYRRCAMQKRHNVHISIFQKFALALRNRVQMAVRDPKILQQIAEGVADDMREHFPVGAEADI